jgi:hypothetical protein
MMVLVLLPRRTFRPTRSLSELFMSFLFVIFG